MFPINLQFGRWGYLGPCFGIYAQMLRGSVDSALCCNKMPKVGPKLRLSKRLKTNSKIVSLLRKGWKLPFLSVQFLLLKSEQLYCSGITEKINLEAKHFQDDPGYIKIQLYRQNNLEIGKTNGKFRIFPLENDRFIATTSMNNASIDQGIHIFATLGNILPGTGYHLPCSKIHPSRIHFSTVWLFVADIQKSYVMENCQGFITIIVAKAKRKSWSCGLAWVILRLSFWLLKPQNNFVKLGLTCSGGERGFTHCRDSQGK